MEEWRVVEGFSRYEVSNTAICQLVFCQALVKKML